MGVEGRGGSGMRGAAMRGEAEVVMAPGPQGKGGSMNGVRLRWSRALMSTQNAVFTSKCTPSLKVTSNTDT